MNADQLVLPEHGYDQNGSSTGQLDHGNRPWFALDVGRLHHEVGDML